MINISAIAHTSKDSIDGSGVEKVYLYTSLVPGSIYEAVKFASLLVNLIIPERPLLVTPSLLAFGIQSVEEKESASISLFDKSQITFET